MGVLKKSSKVMALVAAGLLASSVVDAAPNPNFHIYIAYGQSNMAGNGPIVPAEDQATDPKNFIMLASHTANASSRSGSTSQSIETGKWYPAIPPMFHPFEKLSPADYFGRAMVDSLPGVTVGIIPVAIGAVGIDAFDKDRYQAYFSSAANYIQTWAKDYDSNPYQRIVDLGKKAKEVGVIKGFIFHQGETDGTGSEWQSKVYKTYKDFVTALDLDENEVAFVAGEMMDDPTGNSGQGSCCSSKNGGIAQLGSQFKKFGVASSQGLKGNGADPYHFGREGVIELGRRYCSEMLKLIDKTIDPTAPAVNLTDPTSSVVPDEPPEEYGPYSGTAINIPGTVEAEEFNKGGAEQAYHDESTGNEGGKFRKGDVDIYQPNMGLVVGHAQTGEWLKYTVNVAEAGEYEISALVAGESTSSGSFVLYLDDVRIGTEMTHEKGGLSAYSVVSGGTASLPAGDHELKIEITKDWIDIDYVEFKKKESSAVVDTTPQVNPPAGGDSAVVVPPVDTLMAISKVKFNATEVESSFDVFDMMGARVAHFNAQNMADAIRTWKQMSASRMPSVYMIRSAKTGMVAKIGDPRK